MKRMEGKGINTRVTYAVVRFGMYDRSWYVKGKVKPTASPISRVTDGFVSVFLGVL